MAGDAIHEANRKAGRKTTVFEVTITLKSDLCCGTGESDGVAVDVVTALDACGLPIIPAKRLKGLLRESAELISDVSDTEQKKLVDGLFGAPGSNSPGKLRFGTAEIAGSEGIQRYVREQGYSPQKVADVYTITRSGTRIDDDGVAANQTLRTIQLVNHLDPDGNSTKFVFRVRGEGLDPDEKTLFEGVVKCLRAIGMGKNRGLGEVVCEVRELGPSSAVMSSQMDTTPSPNDAKTSFILADRDAELHVYPYRVTLESDAIVSGGAGQPLDYIPGSMIQGIFARYLCNGEGGEGFFERHVLAGSRFSNAYLEVVPGSGFSRPVPMTYKAVKNAKVLAPDDLRFFDEARAAVGGGAGVLDVRDGKDPCQLVALSGYVSGDVSREGSQTGPKARIGSPKMSYSFHSSTAASEQVKQFYSLRHLNAGQIFCGTITATEEAAARFKEVVKERDGGFSIGGSISAGFGACRLEVGDPVDNGSGALQIDKARTEGAANGGASACKLKAGDWVAIEFASDLIYIDKNGNNRTDAKVFAEYLNESSSLGFRFRTDGDGFRAFMRTVTIGGYNAKWKLPKRQYIAFEKGSVLVAQVSKTSEQAPCLPLVTWVGELNVEGFGQLYVRKVDSYRKPILAWSAEAFDAVRDGEPYQDGVERVSVDGPDAGKDGVADKGDAANGVLRDDDAGNVSDRSAETAVAAFKRGIRYNELREKFCGECAPQLAIEFVKNNASGTSKSSAMRIGNILRTAEKESSTEWLAKAFGEAAGKSFSGDKTLGDTCKDLEAEFDALVRDGDIKKEFTGHESKLNRLFSLFVRSFLGYVKQGYLAKDNSDAGEGGAR